MKATKSCTLMSERERERERERGREGERERTEPAYME